MRYNYFEVCDSLNHRKTKKAKLALRMIDCANEQDRYGIVTWVDAITDIYGDPELWKEETKEEYIEILQDVLDKAMTFASELQPEKPLMRIRELVEGKPRALRDDNGDLVKDENNKTIYEDYEYIRIIGYKIKTKDDQEYIHRNGVARKKMVDGLLDGGIGKLEENSKVDPKTRIGNENSIQKIETIRNGSKYLLPNVKHVGNPENEGRRKEILDMFSKREISHTEMNHMLSRIPFSN